MCEDRKPRKLIAVLLAMWLIFPAGTARSSSATVVTLWIDNPVMQVGSMRQPIDAQGTRPVIVESRTLVPIRAVIEAFGGVIEWDSTTQRVMIVLGDNTLDLWVGKSTASLNGKSMPIDAANPRVMPVILSGRTMVPLRFVSESVGMTVAWDQATRRIQLTRATEEPPSAPSAPVLMAPAHGTHLVNTMPWLSWQTDDGVDYSSLRILSPTGTEVLAKSNLSGTDYRVPLGTLADGTYTWQVAAHNDGGWGPWSALRTFTVTSVAAPVAPTLLTPGNQTTVTDLATTSFTWQSVTGADRYRLRILSGDDVITTQDSLDEPSYLIPFDSVPIGAGEYTWQAAAHGEGGWGAWSTASTFSVPRPENGAILKRLTAFRGGRGQLTIKVDAGRDAVLKLVKEGDAQASIAIYVRADATATLTGIPDGTYRILYARGDAYDVRHAVFARNMSSAEFDDTIRFTTTGTTYSSWTLTLYAVSGGNAGSSLLPGDAFGGY